MLDYELEHRYRSEEGRVLLTGVAALARIPIEQLRRDRAAGLDTAAFLSGYPGSPLGGFDQEMQRAIKLVPDLPIVHQPALNEELGASSVMGSQLAAARPDHRHDGVVGFWYGKAPGLDRAGDALRHGVFAGTSPHGGAVALVGDDPSSKSSTMPSSSDATLVDLHMPVLYPGTIAECVELGLHAVAVSRASGLWSSMKVVTAVADGSGVVDLPVLDSPPVMPTIEVDGEVWRCTPSARFLGPRMLEVEREFREIRLPLAKRYGAENGLNRIGGATDDAWIGLVASGFTYYETLEALRRLGLSGDDIERAGIRLLHLRMPVPFDDEIVRRFASGLDEIVVIEEKNPTLEWLVRNTLYGGPDQPLVVGKADEVGEPLLRAWGQLDADAIAPGLRRRLERRLADRLAPPPAPVRERSLIPLSVNRTPFFCSGCPHNHGTKVPEGAVMASGTGCHGMTLLMEPERVGEGIGLTAMGNEGAHWIGMAPFVDTDHIFQNYGDGTYFHSGQLAIQYCVGAGVDITFKILFNHTVAMTGGQDSVSPVGVPQLATILLEQGVSQVVITADDTDKYRGVDLPRGVEVRDRDEIVDTQSELATIGGVTVLIHDQACAAELRRGRRRGTVETPDHRVVINHRICEGCGDCGDVSSCLSVQPIDTPLGRKTAIDQASCNFDFSCMKGDCPAFMTVTTNGPTATERSILAPPQSGAPDRITTSEAVRLRMAGIGGTGVVTVAQILATAAMIDGWDVLGLDQTGLSQKAGPVVSDVVIARPGAATSNLVGVGQADIVLGFDALVASSDRAIEATNDQTLVVASVHETPTGGQILHPELVDAGSTAAEAKRRLDDATTPTNNRFLDAADLTERITGSTAAANVLLLGVAVQTGAIPVAIEAIERAIELNGVAVEANLAALGWGRAWASDAADVAARLGSDATEVAITTAQLPRALADRIERSILPDQRSEVATLTADLVDYQDADYAIRFLDSIDAVAIAEQELDDQALLGAGELTITAARSLHKLMAYKDEYEVARLMLLPEAQAQAAAVGGPATEVTWHLHPPMLKALGRDDKIEFGVRTTPAIKALRAGKRLRGTRLDPFGRTEMRTLERSLVTEFEATLTQLANRLDASNRSLAIEIAGLPDTVRGFEDLKVRRAAEYRSLLAERMTSFD